MTVIKQNLKRIWDCLVTKAPEITSLLQPGLKPEEIEKPQITWRENFFPNSIQQPDITFPDGYSI